MKQNYEGWEWGRRDGESDTSLHMPLAIFLTFRIMLMFLNIYMY